MLLARSSMSTSTSRVEVGRVMFHRRRRLRSLLLAMALVATTTALVADDAGTSHADSLDMSETCTITNFHVPADVTQVTFDLYGAQGESIGGGDGGLGGRTTGTIAVTPFETLVVVIGASGDNPACAGANGGGGRSPNRGGGVGGGATG